MTSTSETTGDANAVTDWFGDGFTRLHPLLQALHREGGRLGGPIQLKFGAGLAGAIGRRLARKMGIPAQPGAHHLDVDIGHDARALLWHRCFDATHELHSSFHPVGHWPDGYWIERTGPLQLELAVDVRDGGWHWRVIGVCVRGVRIPRWLVPRSTAYKQIEDGRYRFFVGFSVPMLGVVFSYSGLLDANTR